jgi:hypothetical protein
MPQKLKPIEEVIANALPPLRGKARQGAPQKIEPKTPPQPPPKGER